MLERWQLTEQSAAIGTRFEALVNSTAFMFSAGGKFNLSGLQLDLNAHSTNNNI